MWKDVFGRQQTATGKLVERFKSFDPDSEKDVATAQILIDQNNPAFFSGDGAMQVDIMQVDLEHLPTSIREGTESNSRLALQTLETRLPRVFLRSRKLRGLEAEVRTIIESLQKQQNGEDITPEESRLLQESWVVQGARQIHVAWSNDNKQRAELLAAYDDLDPFEKEKDVVFIDAGIQALQGK